MIGKEELISHIEEDDKEFDVLRSQLRDAVIVLSSTYAKVEKMIEDDKNLLAKLREGVE
jgi:hypothetical protein